MIAIYQSLIQLFSTIDSCIERKVQLPTLILVYAGIDSLGWLAAPDPSAIVGERFVAWVDGYLLAAKPMPCTGIDLYSARCGILHTMTGDSDLISKGRAKRVAYAWGSADVLKLQDALDRTYPGECVAVHIGALAEGLRLGTDLMFDDAERNPELEQRLIQRGGRFFVGMNGDFAHSMLPSGLVLPAT